MDRKKLFVRTFSLLLSVVLLAGIFLPTHAEAAGNYRTGWVITCGDKVPYRKTTVSFKNKATMEYLYIDLTSVSGCSVKAGTNARRSGNRFMIPPSSTGKIVITTWLGNAGCVDFQAIGSMGSYPNYTVSCVGADGWSY